MGGALTGEKFGGLQVKRGPGNQVLVILKNGTSVIAPTKLVVHKVIKISSFLDSLVVVQPTSAHLQHCKQKEKQ